MEETQIKTEKVSIQKRKFFIPLGSFVMSFVLHSLVLIPIFLSDVVDADMKLKWMESFEELEGLSTETGRWATFEQSSEKKEEKKVEEPEREVEVEAEVEPEPKPKIKEKLAVNTTVKTTKKKKKKKKLKSEKKPIEKKKKEKIEYDRSGPSGLPNISGYGPGNAVYSAMVRTDRIRGTIFQKEMRTLIQGIPDYRIILQDTTIDPIGHVDMLYVASAQPANISATFLAMKHRMTNGMIKGKLDRRFKDVPPWTNYRNKPMRDLLPVNDTYQDERKIFLARNGLAILGKEKWIKKLYRKDARSESSMMTTLNKIQEATEDEQSLIIVTGRKMQIPIPGLGRQVFKSVKLEISNIKTPKILVEVAFEDKQRAVAFVGNCSRMKKSLIGKMGILKFAYGSFVERLKCTARDNYVVVNGTYEQKEILKVLKLISQFLPRPKMLDQLPESGSVSDLRNPVKNKEISNENEKPAGKVEKKEGKETLEKKDTPDKSKVILKEDMLEKDEKKDASGDPKSKKETNEEPSAKSKNSKKKE